MKRLSTSILLATASFLYAASAATIQLMPDITGIEEAGYSTAGRLTGSGITAADVAGWLGSRADGWYTTTGNGDMRWGSTTANPADQTLNLPSMNGTQGCCAGLKMTIDNIQDYSSLTFSFSLTSPSTASTYTYSLWYETSDGEIIQICQDSRGNDGSPWNVSYNLTPEQLADLKAYGNGKIYAIIGSQGGNGDQAIIGDLSLEGLLAIPEPATASLGLFGLAVMMLRRRRV